MTHFLASKIWVSLFSGGARAYLSYLLGPAFGSEMTPAAGFGFQGIGLHRAGAVTPMTWGGMWHRVYSLEWLGRLSYREDPAIIIGLSHMLD